MSNKTKTPTSSIPSVGLVYRPLKIYIAGPMSGQKDMNFPAFKRAVNIIIAEKHIPVDPSVTSPGLSYQDYLDIAFSMLSTCDAIYLLPGWGSSPGARAEYAYADAVGMLVIQEEVK